MRRSGFSLLELLVAVSVLAIALLGLLEVTARGHRLDALTREKGWALSAAQSQMEDVMASTWDELPNRHNEEFDVVVETPGGTTSKLDSGTGRTKPGLVTVLASPHDDFLKIEVSVKWKSVIGKDVIVTLHSCVARH